MKRARIVTEITMPETYSDDYARDVAGWMAGQFVEDVDMRAAPATARTVRIVYPPRFEDEQETPVDYRALLLKYMTHVLAEESTSFIDYNTAGSFTPQEAFDLREVEAIAKRRVP